MGEIDIDITQLIKVNKNSRIPMYQQIVNSLVNNISNGNIALNQKLPSINSISENFYLSRDTVEKAYNVLKERNIITSIPRRGNYVTKTDPKGKLNVLFLINKLSSYKLKIFNTFVNRVGVNYKVDLKIYNCEEKLFLDILKNNEALYDHIVIMPHFKSEDSKHLTVTDEALKAITAISKEKLLFIDNIKYPLGPDVPAVYQDFDNDIFEALTAGLPKIQKYKKLFLVYPKNSVYPYPMRILHGFRRFCTHNHLQFEILEEICEGMLFKKGDLFITIEEGDLVSVVQQIRDSELQMGVDVGVISYNETPLKELLGIAVISTDFEIMGSKAAEMLLDNTQDQFKVPFNFIDRRSL